MAGKRDASLTETRVIRELFHGPVPGLVNLVIFRAHFSIFRAHFTIFKERFAILGVYFTIFGLYFTIFRVYFTIFRVRTRSIFVTG